MGEKRIPFYIVPIIQNGKPCILIRKFFMSDKIIKEMLTEIIKNRKVNLDIEVSFRDPFLAKRKLKKLDMI